MDRATEGVLAACAKSALNGFGGELVEGEMFWLGRWNRAVGRSSPATAVQVDLAKAWSRDGTKDESLDRLVPRIRESLKGLWLFRDEWLVDGAALLEGVDAVVVWRLAERWQSGASWATDARRCVSVPSAQAECRCVLWLGLVRPRDIAAVVWPPGTTPLWRTVRHPLLGTLVVAVDDGCEVIVDPSALVGSEGFEVGGVTSMFEFERVRAGGSGLALLRAGLG